MPGFFPRLVPHLALLAAMCVWSTSYVALRIALTELSPLVVMAGRMLTASVVFMPIWAGCIAHCAAEGIWARCCSWPFASPACIFYLKPTR